MCKKKAWPLGNGGSSSRRIGHCLSQHNNLVVSLSSGKRGLPNWYLAHACVVWFQLFIVSRIYFDSFSILSLATLVIFWWGFWHSCHCAAAGPAAEIPASWKIGQIFCICWLFSYDWTPKHDTRFLLLLLAFWPYAYAEKPIIWFHAAMNIQTLNQKSIGPMCTKKEKNNFWVLFYLRNLKGNWFWLERVFSKSPSTYLHSLSKLFCLALIFFLNKSSYANEVNDVTSLSLKTSDIFSRNIQSVISPKFYLIRELCACVTPVLMMTNGPFFPASV